MRRRLRTLRATLRDIRQFGLPVLRRFLSPERAGPVFAVEARDYGDLELRRNSWDLDLARSVLFEGAYELPGGAANRARLKERYREILDAGRKPVIINAGGFIGFSALWFGRQWPEAEIVSIEPAPENLELLRRNLAGRTRQTVIAGAVGSEPGKAVLSDHSEGCAIQTERASDGVNVITVDEAVDLVPDGEPFICNIDIEGFELDLFATNTDWIDRFALVIIEPHDWREPGARLSGGFQRAMAIRPFEIYPRDGVLFYLRA